MWLHFFLSPFSLSYSLLRSAVLKLVAQNLSKILLQNSSKLLPLWLQYSSLSSFIFSIKLVSLSYVNLFAGFVGINPSPNPIPNLLSRLQLLFLKFERRKRIRVSARAHAWMNDNVSPELSSPFVLPSSNRVCHCKVN